jgi:glycosyltransferase involved in cell wall biosynthesis
MPGNDSKLARVKSLIIDLSRRYGGASTRAITLAKGMGDWGAAIAALEGSPVSQAARRAELPVITVASSRIDPRIPYRIAAAIRSGGFQLVDTQNIQSKVWGSAAVRLSGSVLVSTLNSDYVSEQRGNPRGYVYSALDRLTNGPVKRYIAVSENIKQALCDAGIPAAAIDLIHNGIEVPEKVAVADRAALRSSLGFPQDMILCAAVGRLVSAKGYSDLIKAFTRVASSTPRARCLIAGDGALRTDLQQQIAELGLSGRVLLLGDRSHEDVLQLLRASDLFVMSSISEGIPYALLEAGAAGLPIVATNCGGIPEVVRDGLEALLVEPGDVASLAAALERMCRDAALAMKLARQARERIRSEFSAEAQIDATKRTYIRAVSEF